MDKKVVELLKDRTKGNTMTKVWRQVKESHCSKYLDRKELYCTLLHQLSKPGGIVSALGSKFPPPPPRRKLPSPKLLRQAYLNTECALIDDYKTQIMSTFGTALKFDSTKKVNTICSYNWIICA